VASGSLDGLDPFTARYLSLIDMPRERCASGRGSNEWQEAFRNISDETAGYLNPGEMEQFWQQVISSPCYREVSEAHKAWAGLSAAMARRNAPEIIKLGTALLGNASATSQADLAYLTTITAAAHVHVGDMAGARSLLQAQWHRFDHTGPFAFALDELWALTQLAAARTR
jgi:hypothetical protein